MKKTLGPFTLFALAIVFFVAGYLVSTGLSEFVGAVMSLVGLLLLAFSFVAFIREVKNNRRKDT
jgi:hypothetical protein